MAASDSNPFAAAITACDDDPATIQRLYDSHRSQRSLQQRAELLAHDFSHLRIDQHLFRLERQPGFRDHRHCLVFWARPPIHTLRLAEELQRILRDAAPNAWMMPTYRMHLTTLELAFSKTPEEIADLLAQLRPAAGQITSYTHSHRARLVKPRVSYDLSAFAVSWLTAAGEPAASPAPMPPDDRVESRHDDAYTYHHLRRDLFDLVRDAGVPIASRYQVPSAHITLGRFLDDVDHDTVEKRERWAAAVDGINRWLETDVWDRPDAEFIGEWVVGHEKGLDLRAGTLWYGGGRTVIMGEGF